MSKLTSHVSYLVPRTSYLVSFLILLLSSCDAEYPFSQLYPCYFALKYQTHPTSLAFAAVQSPGMHVSVTVSGDGRTTARHVYVTSNDGKTPREDNIIRTDEENYRTFQLGRSNSVGLVVGCTNFSGPMAYDRSCPNCTSLQALNFTRNGQQVGCDKCGRTYDLETGGIVEGERGESLMRYECRFDGAWLTVTNGLKP